MDNIEEVKKIIYTKFGRNIADEEAKYLLNLISTTTREIHSYIQGFSNTKFANSYSNLSKLKLVLSPSGISEQVEKLITEVGSEDFEKSGNYKLAKEMLIAGRFVIGLKKIYKQEWYVVGEDSPDIILVSRNSRGWNEKPFSSIRLEVMEIPELVKEKWEKGKVTQEIASFIREKKFLKRYGSYSHLLVYIRFTEKELNTYKIHQSLKKITGNPYYQIWLMALTEVGQFKFMNAMVYPEYHFMNIDLKQEPHLLF